ncbi:cyclic nucleotide-binding domain-containing protein [Prosthecobacter sp.]|uniref:cyclic nucleotide-binding domain-containing protein n=1 Tax=Prosthecobacter sp. TaxID=1965333 RepID=UPI002AB8222F|nr:cyclic nucleotide-binding domain-containing protein [Prosthecobacter sp.]MDZ4405104.1 cyclic nucleotide-binding domain-containing protein [Prosthecobacter sp.]
MATEHFQRGQVIFREGDKSQEAYFIVNGLVEITINTSHGVQSLAKIGPGEIFGEMGMIMDRPRSATATALENTTVETVAETEFEQQIIQRPDRLHVYLSTLFERIRKTDLLLTTSTNATVPLVPKAKPAKEPVFRVKLRSHYDETGLDLEPVEKTITKLPFRIGRSYFDTATSALARNDLSIEEPTPYQLSRNHCEIDFEHGHFILRDRGSKLGSWVNGDHIGVDAGCITSPLKVGENKIIFGNGDSPHRYSITIEELQ